MNPTAPSETLPGLLAARVAATPRDVAFMEKDAEGCWRPIRWDAFGRAVGDMAAGLRAIGMKPGDRAGILMPNSVQWEMVQHAVYYIGGVVIGLDLHDPPERMDEIFTRCPPDVLFVDRITRLRHLSAQACNGLRTVIAGQPDGDAPERFSGECYCLDHLPRSASEDQAPMQVPAHATASILFTSGTTGRPKAFSYQHQQLVLATRSIVRHFSDLPRQAHTACWLPLANPFQRIINYCALAMNWQAFMVPVPSTIMDHVPEIAPHVFAAVPRFYEKVMEGIQREIEKKPAPLRTMANWALRTGQAYRQTITKGHQPAAHRQLTYKIADRLVLRRIRAVMGPQLRYCISGSAGMRSAVIPVFDALGWTLLEAYGISENIVPMAMNVPGASRVGSVGRPLAENTLRIAGDGEVLVKGMGVAAEAGPMTEDGFFKTGDLGTFDADGYLWLTGRKSDLFKLSTGRKVIPGAIEDALCGIEGVSYAVAAGQNRQYVVALLNMDPGHWRELKRHHNGPEGSHRHLRHQVRQRCAHLPSYCHPVDIVVVQDPFSPQSGELTINLKLRRGFVLERYAAKLEALYQHHGAH